MKNLSLPLKILLLLSIFLLPVSLFGVDDDSCDGQMIGQLNNKNAVSSHQITDTVDKQGNDKLDYFYFNISTAGTVSVKYQSDINSKFYFGKIECEQSSDNIKVKKATSYTGSLTVAQGDIVYLSVRDPKKTLINYIIDITFTPDTEKITLDNDSIKENTPLGTLVGLLDVDNDYEYTYNVETVLDDNNVDVGLKFKVNDGTNELVVNSILEKKDSDYYDVKIKASNKSINADIKEKTFRIYIEAVGAYPCSEPRAFATRYNGSYIGDLVAIGNSNICADKKAPFGKCDANQIQRNDKTNIIFIDPSSSTAVSTEPSSLLNTTGAELKLPDGARVKWAGLYWQGEIWDLKDDVENAKKTLANSVKFKVPNGSYTDITVATNTSHTTEDFNFFLVNRKGGGDPWTDKDRFEFHYQGFKDVTDLLKAVELASNDETANGTYWLANIQATLGNLHFPGVEAAWTLQVAYQADENDPEATLRSITITDGYYGLYSDDKPGDAYAKENACPQGGANTGTFGNSIEFTINNFLTPSSAGVKTDLSLFLTESDPDSGTRSSEVLSVTKKDGTISYVDGPNATPPSKEAWTYAITDKDGNDNLERTPAYIYPIGMTIKNYKKLDILSQKQSETTIKFQTGSDKLILGVIGFSTELYEPRVCYYIDTIQDENSDTIFEDGTFLPNTEVEPDKEYTYNLWFSNIQKPGVTPENAELVQIYLNMTDFEYTPDSTYLQNLGVTSNPLMSDSYDINDASDLGDHDANLSTWRIGTGATQLEGGTLVDSTFNAPSNEKVNVSFQGKLTISDAEAENIDLLDYFEFKASYKTSTLVVPIGFDHAANLVQCKDLNTSSAVRVAAGGIFNVIMTSQKSNLVANGFDPMADTFDSVNAIPTQVSNKEFNITAVSLQTNDSTGQDTDFDEFKGFVSVELIEQPEYLDTDTDEMKQAKCDSAAKISSYNNYLSFGNKATFSDTLTLKYDTAHKDASFRVKYLSADYNLESVNWNCVNNTFACVWGMLNKTYDNPIPCEAECKPGAGTGANQTYEACIECVFGGSHAGAACARDNFAIRPDKFIFDAPSGKDIELLTSAQDYTFGINGVDYSTEDPTSEYTRLDINDTNFDINTTMYSPIDSPLLGAQDSSLVGKINKLTPSLGIPIIDGVGTDALNINFDDVGNAVITVMDQTWAQVDIDSGDTVAECGDDGAYICGDINATFIPESFTFANVELHDTEDGNFTYISNDLNMSAHISLDINATNAKGKVTKNFKKDSWENPVDIRIDVPVVVTAPVNPAITSHKDDVNETIKLRFNTGTLNIPYNEGNASKKLMFNYSRLLSEAKNPFKIDGADVTLNASSAYTSSSGGTATVTGTSIAEEDATFIYGRTNSPRTLIKGPTGPVFIYYEAFCDGTGCNKALLPNAPSFSYTNDPRWYVNTLHTSTTGEVGDVTQKGSALLVSSTPAAKTNPDKVDLTYTGAKGYPYKTTMENNASSWLIYNKYDTSNTDKNNEFEVEFEGIPTSWTGKRDTVIATDKNNTSQRVNRRSMW